MQAIKKMLSEYVDIALIPEATLLVFDNHVEALLQRMQDKEQYTEKIIEFDVSAKAREATEKMIAYLEKTYEQEISLFEQSMLLLHIGGMVDQQ